MNREIRIYRYLCKHTGNQRRDKIMHWTGFPDPKQHPVIAYVEFQNSIIRLNNRLSRVGKQIVRNPDFSRDRAETYALVSITQKAA